jgi:hypothetical protein
MIDVQLRERFFVGLLAAFAAIRMLTFAGAFPFFTNVDEHRHVDMALKYARGALPRPERAPYEPEFPRLLALYGTQEYVHPAGRPPAPPTWQLGDAVLERRIQRNRARFSGAPNLEIFQSPVYYALAGGWLATVRASGLDWGRALYAVRALGALALAGLIAMAWALLRETHPDRATVRLGVPLLLAAAPLDVFHYVTGDSLSPLSAGLAFAGSLRCAIDPGRRPLDFAFAGAATAAAILTKSTSIVAVGLLLFATARTLAGGPRGHGRRLRLGLLWASFALPFGAWVGRTWVLSGSLLGTASKVAGLGWGVRPVGEWLSHPLFTPSGLWAFLRDLVPIFWRGEVVWYREVLAHPSADLLYGVTTALFLAAALASWRRGDARARSVQGASLYCVAGAVAVLAVLSLRFVFSDTTNPSAAHPYFVQGRLVSGAWLPFAILYTAGIERICGVLAPSRRLPAAAVLIGGVAAAALVSELVLAWPVFGSPYNFYHLPGAHD